MCACFFQLKNATAMLKKSAMAANNETKMMSKTAMDIEAQIKENAKNVVVAEKDTKSAVTMADKANMVCSNSIDSMTFRTFNTVGDTLIT